MIYIFNGRSFSALTFSFPLNNRRPEADTTSIEFDMSFRIRETKRERKREKGKELIGVQQ